MRKLLIGIIAVVIVGMVVVFLPKHTEEAGNGMQSKEVIKEDDEDDDDEDEFRIETLSDKNIYFKADTVLPDDSVINDMMDLANGYAIMRAAYCDAELWFRFKMIVVDAIGSIKTDVIKDKEIRKAAEKYIKTLTDLLPRDTILWQPVDSILWEKVSDAYANYASCLSSRYTLNRYGRITEEDVREYMNIKQFIPQYDSIFNMRKKQKEEDARYLWLMAEQTPNFDRECIYTVEFAHQLRHKEPHPAIPKLEGLMKSGKYSRYLHEVWRTWRCLKQLEISPSRDGMILNLKYNKMRYRCLNTILKQIVKNPRDIKAINDFCLLATCDNIIRYCDYLFGNSAPLEQMMLFPEILMDDEEDDGENEDEDEE